MDGTAERIDVLLHTPALAEVVLAPLGALVVEHRVVAADGVARAGCFE